ncbi:phosphatase PAP2 family protein [Castellaniella sp. FW104-16D08]|uniref:phosphatase PAP2 family protein n=1 Tax=unclassified Castellaniella TaxID=2617606 RepID=UPI0033155D03
MEHLNDALFLWINASHPTAGALWIGRLCANALVYLFPLYLVLSWLRADEDGRNALLQAVAAAIIALILSWAISKVWFHPRPFVVGIGHTYLSHKPTASLPSNHLSFIWALCMGLALHRVRRRTALILALIGLPVAWARIYMGVHFPLDMVAAAITAIAAGLISLPLRHHVVPEVRRTLEPLYRALFAGPIRKGWFRS